MAINYSTIARVGADLAQSVMQVQAVDPAAGYQVRPVSAASAAGGPRASGRTRVRPKLTLG